MGSTGVGALAATLVMAARREVHGLGRWIIYASTGFGASLILFSFSRSLPLSVALLLPAGFCMLIQMASSNTLIQTMVPDELRGRVMSVYSMMFMGMAPFGALVAGAIAHRIGSPLTVALGGTLCIAGSLVFGSKWPAVRGEARQLILAQGHEERRTPGRDDRPSGRPERPQARRTLAGKSGVGCSAFWGLTAAEKICKSDSMKLRISATETARRFSELMNRVRYRGESFVVERGGKPICEILPAKPPKFTGRELADLLRSLPTPDEEYFTLVENLTKKQSKVEKSRWPR